MATKSLYVGNISYNTTEDDLRELYNPFGPVTEVRIIAGRGFGFVDIPEENVPAAIEQTNGKEYQGRRISVSEAKPKTERAGAGYGSNRSAGGGSRGGYAGARPAHGGRRGY